MRSGVLSDESIMRNCAQYRPIPLGMVEKIIGHIKPKRSGLQTKPVKHSRPSPRPVTFNAMSFAMAKHVDPTNPLPICMHMNAKYDRELAKRSLPPTVSAMEAPEVDEVLLVEPVPEVENMDEGSMPAVKNELF